MPLFRKKHEIVDAIQLSWANWGEICKRGGIGLLKDGFAEINLNGRQLDLMVRGLDGTLHYKEGDWIFMRDGRNVCAMTKKQFEIFYEPWTEPKPE